jgi:tetratricopeptide (TPR) repeat protein
MLLETEEQKTLGQLIDTIVGEKPDMAEAIRLCAIPHWFNKDILAWLRGDGNKPSKRTETILEELKLRELAFGDAEKLFLHDNVRNLLLYRWRKENPEAFKKLNGEIATYYGYKLQGSVSAGEAEWEREEMYHLLVADKERGIERFKSLCYQAIDSYSLSTLDLLFSLAGEQVDNLNTGIQLWIQFFGGKKYQISNDWKKASEIWEELRKNRAFFSGDLEPTLAVHLSILYKDNGQWNKAIECLDESLKNLEKKGDRHGMITILKNRGFLHKDRGDLQQTENDFQRALEISKEVEDEREIAVSLRNLGLLSKDNGKWDEALEHFRTSLAILERIGDEHIIARSYDDRGLLYKDRGLSYKNREDLQTAEADFVHALKIFKRIGNEHEKAGAFSSLGLFYKDRGVLYNDRDDLQKAEENFQHAHEILENIGDQRRIADVFNYLGFLYTAAMELHDFNGHFQRALTNFQEALTRLKAIGDERGTAVILNNLGLLYQRKGERQSAVDYFRQSLGIAEKIGDRMNAATTMYELASLYDAMEEYDKAIDLLERVVKIAKRVGHPDARIKRSRESLEMIKAKTSVLKNVARDGSQP